MPRARVRASIVIVLASIAASASAERPGWTPLFDGQSIDAWVKRGGNATYRIEDGVIVGVTGDPKENTFLCTPGDYADFILEFEFKVDPRLNSGVQIRSNSVPGYKSGLVHGYQVEIDPSERAFTGGIYDEGRRGWLQDLKRHDAARQAFRPGEWNKIRVQARGEHIETWVNGVPAVDLRDAVTRSGFIALQVHASDSQEPLEVRWRNLRIQDFGDPWRVPPESGRWLLRERNDVGRWEHADKPGAQVAWKWRNEGSEEPAEGNTAQPGKMAPDGVASGGAGGVGGLGGVGVSPATPPSIRQTAGGYLEIEPGSGNLATREAFGDCRLHVEFAVDDNEKAGQGNGNSGVYVQRRYEVQILNSAGQAPADDICGAIYKAAVPAYNMARPAGQWQTYDITFFAPRWDLAGRKIASARITLYHNGTLVHDNVEVPGQTGAGQPESPAPGPLLLQDHGNRVRFRNIWVAPIEKLEALNFDAEYPSKPFVLYKRFPGFGNVVPCGGELVAIWQDGRILRTLEQADQPCQMEGRLSEGDLAKLVSYIAADPRLLERKDGGFVLDAPADTYVVRFAERKLKRQRTVGHQEPEMLALRALLLSIEIPDAKPVEPPEHIFP